MPSRTYLSIGEVLIGVKAEFPDITISKIRFLEAEGLIEPERTPSGYRKFYEEDVRRLKAILRMQRDEYLPLRVIRERLADGAADREVATMPGRDVASDPGAPEASGGAQVAVGETLEAPVGMQMTVDEMSGATGVPSEVIAELESYGIVCGHGPAEARHFDGDDFLVLTIVRDLLKYGVEPRHLTLFRNFADREAAFLESIVLPRTRQRNPDAKRSVGIALREMSLAARKLSAALLRVRLQRYLTP